MNEFLFISKYFNFMDDKFTITNLKRDGRKNESRTLDREDLIMQNYSGDLEKMKNYIGPAFIGCGTFGIFAGIFNSARELTFKNRPKKLVITTFLNIIGRDCSRFANAGASITLLYCLLKKVITFVFSEELSELTENQKTAIYGITTGMIYKSSRGIKSLLFFGVISCIGSIAISNISRSFDTKKKPTPVFHHNHKL